MPQKTTKNKQPRGPQAIKPLYSHTHDINTMYNYINSMTDSNLEFSDKIVFCDIIQYAHSRQANPNSTYNELLRTKNVNRKTGRVNIKPAYKTDRDTYANVKRVVNGKIVNAPTTISKKKNKNKNKYAGNKNYTYRNNKKSNKSHHGGDDIPRGFSAEDEELEVPKFFHIQHETRYLMLRLGCLGDRVFREDFEMYDDDEAMLMGDYLYND